MRQTPENLDQALERRAERRADKARTLARTLKRARARFDTAWYHVATPYARHGAQS